VHGVVLPTRSTGAVTSPASAPLIRAEHRTRAIRLGTANDGILLTTIFLKDRAVRARRPASPARSARGAKDAEQRGGVESAVRSRAAIRVGCRHFLRRLEILRRGEESAPRSSGGTTRTESAASRGSAAAQRSFSWRRLARASPRRLWQLSKMRVSVSRRPDAIEHAIERRGELHVRMSNTPAFASAGRGLIEMIELCGALSEFTRCEPLPA